jgi:hypothetical protein
MKRGMSLGGVVAAVLGAGRDEYECIEEGRVWRGISTESLKGVCFKESEMVPLLLLRRWWSAVVAAGLGGASVAQGAKGAGRGMTWGEVGLVIGEYVGVGTNPMADCRLRGVEAGLASTSYRCRFSSVSIIWRASSTTAANLGCSCVPAVDEALRRAPKFLKACGIDDQRLLLFFSALVFSTTILSNASNGLRAGVAGVACAAECASGDWNAEASKVTGVGGATSLSLPH